VGHIKRGAYKMSEELKDILKPPFKVTAYLYGGNDIEVSVRLSEHKRDLKYKLKYWIADALNEKAEREFAEPLKWGKTGLHFVCPKCDNHTPFSFSFCPHCGQKLLKPEEK